MKPFRLRDVSAKVNAALDSHTVTGGAKPAVSLESIERMQKRNPAFAQALNDAAAAKGMSTAEFIDEMLASQHQTEGQQIEGQQEGFQQEEW